uniref:DUF5641 domain-containing protein n=1 Tax=Caenorhabditis tropicalis TaxID=1561998 RepID=A0A1I7TJ99_9PELO
MSTKPSMEIPIQNDNEDLNQIWKRKSLEDTENEIIPLNKTNSLEKCGRIMSYVIRFLKNRVYKRLGDENKKKLEEKIPEIKIDMTSDSTQVTIPECKNAQKVIIRNHQMIYGIWEDKEKWRRIINDGFIGKRGTGRIIEPENMIQHEDNIVYQHYIVHRLTPKPIVEPKSSLGKLIIRKIHQQNSHAGPATVLGLILDKYAGKGWKRAVKKELNCCICKSSNRRASAEQQVEDIPEEKTDSHFNHIVLNFLGPIKKTKSTTSETTMSHVVLFICATSKCVHSELISDLSTNEILMALTRFVERRGYPTSITTDNAATFTLMSKIMAICSKRSRTLTEEVSGITKTKEIVNELMEKDIKWFLIQRQTHGIMVPLSVCLSLVNIKPLTYTAEKDITLIQPFDILVSGFLLNEFDDPKMLDQWTAYIHQFGRSMKHARRFWFIWSRDFLKQYNNFELIAQCHRAFSRSDPPGLGEVVLMADPTVPRDNWKFGVVSQLSKNKNGYLRSVYLKVNQVTKHRDGPFPFTKQKIVTVKSPLRLLIPLELRPNEQIEKPKTTKEAKTVNLKRSICSAKVTYHYSKKPDRPASPSQAQLDYDSTDYESDFDPDEYCPYTVHKGEHVIGLEGFQKQKREQKFGKEQFKDKEYANYYKFIFNKVPTIHGSDFNNYKYGSDSDNEEQRKPRKLFNNYKRPTASDLKSTRTICHQDQLPEQVNPENLQ